MPTPVPNRPIRWDGEDADGIGIGGLSVPESPGPPPPLFFAEGLMVWGRQRFGHKAGIVMDATLQQSGPDSY
jgi:hypothetical protein